MVYLPPTLVPNKSIKSKSYKTYELHYLYSYIKWLVNSANFVWLYLTSCVEVKKKKQQP